jgi:hypothetical protein
MKKLLTSLLAPGLALAMAMTLAGCELYFGEDDNGGGGPGGGGGGWTCAEDADCAAGCYCAKDSPTATGYCEEAGFCSNDADCPDGYTCDERSSCVPDEPETCTTDADCSAGSFCNGEGVCEPSCVCETDAEAQAAGWGYCDEARSTCKPPLAVSCNAPLTCNENPPSCPQGYVPLIATQGDRAGCYNGECNPIGWCDVSPACKAYQHEPDCLAVNACDASYTGIGCQGPGGTPCQAGQPGCICQEYRFASCVDGT